jgi:N-methylhydantoinase B
MTPRPQSTAPRAGAPRPTPAGERPADPIQFEVIRNALVEVTEEMSVSLQRTAFSTNVKTRLDYSCAFVDDQGRMVAQAFCQPAHLVTIGRIVPRAVAEYGAENLHPGDMLCVNDPHRQASHLNDIFLIAPFFHRGRLLGYLTNICHHVDVGGGAPASIGAFRETYQEGIILPVVKLVAKGEIEADLWKLILANVRAQREVAGDMRAQISANNMGLRRLAALYDRYGGERMTAIIGELLDYTEKRTRIELAKLPRGSWEAEGFLDDDGMSDRPVRLKARITIDDDGILFDFAGTDAQRWAPMNCNMTQTFTACVFVLKCLVDPDVPINEGFYKPIRVTAPEGSIVNARHPGAIVGGWEVSTRLCEVLFKALSQPLPDRVPAGTKGMICHVGFGGADPRSGEYYTFLETLGGGYGGRYRSDGPDAVQANIQNTQNAPVEETELNYPVRVARYSLIPDSEGPGRFRGGLGLCREYVFPGHEPIFTTLADRAKFPPWGLFGGGDGKPARYLTLRGGQVRIIPSKGTAPVEQGECVRIETCGGGGYGPAWERDPALVLRDVREEKVSLQRAREVYGVAIDPRGWTIDAETTRRLRQDLSASERRA